MLYDDPGKLQGYPDKPGLWKYFCDENSYEADYVAICKVGENLIIHTDFQSGDRAKSFSDGLQIVLGNLSDEWQDRSKMTESGVGRVMLWVFIRDLMGQYHRALEQYPRTTLGG